MTELIEAMIRKAEDDVHEMQMRLSANPEGPDVEQLAVRITFHLGQASGLRHALFAVRQLDKERTNA